MRKIFCLALALLCVFSCINVSAETPAQESIYSDVAIDHWAYEYINICKNDKYLSGYPDGSFKPEDTITRAEAAKVFAYLTSLKTEDIPQNGYEDVNADEWYAPYVYTAKKLMPPQWKKAGKLYPESPITREESIYMLMLSLGYDKDFKLTDATIPDEFTDKNEISEDIEKAFALALEYGIVNGYEDNSLKPKNSLTRAEFAALIANGCGLFENSTLKWDMDNVTETNAIKCKDGLFFITSKHYFKTEFTVDADGYYNIEMGYTHDDYECYFRLDTTYPDGTAGGFMQGLLHGKTSIEMKVYLKKGTNIINLRHHTVDGTKIYYIKNNGLTDELGYELSPKNERYFLDEPKELKTSIRNYQSKLLKITSDNDIEINFESVNKADVLNATSGIPDDFYSAMIFVTLSNEDIARLGEGVHTLYYSLENGVVLEQEINVSDRTPETKLKYINFSVDKANSTLIMLPNGKNLLVDSATKAMAQNKIIPYLQKHGIKLDYYILTHFHSDHNGLKDQILTDNGIEKPDTDKAKELAEKGSAQERYDYLKNFGYLDSSMVRYYDEIHKIWDLGGVEIDVLNSRYDENGNKTSVYNYPYMKNHEHNYENSTSISFMLKFNGFRYYHAADNYAFNQDRFMVDMIRAGKTDELRCDWFFGNHHFINDVNSEFINTLNPVAVYVPNIQLERRGAYWFSYKENVENYYFSHKKLRDTLISVDTDNARVCVNSGDDWYYETFRYED